MIVEEVLLDLGVLDFGKGVTAKANAALWRSRGDHRPLVGEFSFQCKFRRRDELHDKAMRRCQKFFVTLQDQIAGPDLAHHHQDRHGVPRPGQPAGCA